MAANLFPQHVIARKRDGFELEGAEIDAFVEGAARGNWTDYQLSALLMAVFLKGMTPRETARLTEAIIRSGSTADLSAVPLAKVDKHSTGGVGDKISVPLAPLVAACGVAVPMISGRGLGHTGGTLDKLESIPGMRVGLSLREFTDQVGRIGVAMAGQTDELAPADRKLYALRDVTGTVESIPLICASILGKKLAEGIDALVLDVKFGRGAFMKDIAAARALAGGLVSITRTMGKKARALLTRMEEPLGRTVGNALEIAESLECLRGTGPADVMELTYALGTQMLLVAGVSADAGSARSALERAIASGSALDKFRELVEAQGGDPRVVDDPKVLPRAAITAAVRARGEGWVVDVDAMKIALAALELGAGRARAEERVDPAVGISGLVKTGVSVGADETLCVVHANDAARLSRALPLIESAIRVGPTCGPRFALVAEEIA